MNHIIKRKETNSRIAAEGIFAVTFIICLEYLLMRGSMIDGSGDAASIWESIKTFYTDNRVASYVMYKGFLSIFPYAWLYQLSLLFRTNEFFFVMIYHALLFSYTVAYGVPMLIETVTGYRAATWQKTALGIVLFWYWNRYGALTQLMVDLPSCTMFLMAIHFATLIKKQSGWGKYVSAVMSGLMSGMCANISGQYSVAALFVIAYAILQIWKTEERIGTNKEALKDADQDEKTDGATTKTKLKKPLKVIFQILAILVMTCIPKLLNVWFDTSVVQPLVARGEWIPAGKSWMERGLIRFLRIGRIFYGRDLLDPRGEAIVFSLYGEENGSHLLAMADDGGYGWSIADYFWAFLQQPDDFTMLYLNTFVTMLSDDGRFGHIRVLLPGYTMVYLTLCTMGSSVKKWKDVFNEKALIVLGTLASVIPSIIFTSFEMRFLLSFQCLLFGTALLGPAVPRIIQTVCCVYGQLRENEPVMEHRIPWVFLGWVMFCLILFGYFGAICAGSNLGVGTLYQW